MYMEDTCTTLKLYYKEGLITWTNAFEVMREKEGKMQSHRYNVVIAVFMCTCTNTRIYRAREKTRKNCASVLIQASSGW